MDTNIEREQNLLIEPLTNSDLTHNCNHKRRKSESKSNAIIGKDDNKENEKSKNCKCKFTELRFDIRKNLLSQDYSECPQTLLLTGEPGIGKSMFCKHLQREMLFDWKKHQKPESGDENWFPIYVDLPSLKNPKTEAISETLSKELSLTEEEIHRLLQTPGPSDALLPHILFIFDGYSEIENIHYHLRSFNSDEDFKDHNFCVLNKIDDVTRKKVKFIVTCREESLQRVQRRDLLFAPIKTDSKEVSVVPNSFLQRKIEPFSDEQISCYLKRSCVLRQIEAFEVRENQSSSWSLVEKIKETIDKCGLREIARIPLMLRVIVDVLPEIVANNALHGTDLNLALSKVSKSLSSRLLIDCYIEKVINLIVKRNISQEESKAHKTEESELQRLRFGERIKLQMQSLALRLSRYSTENLAAELLDEDDSLLGSLSPLIEWDSKSLKAKFNNSLFQGFFVANSIEGELIKMYAGLQERSLEMPEGILLNQYLLTGQAVLFLRDSVNEQRLKSDQLMHLVMLSSQKEGNHQIQNEKIQENGYSNSQSQFAIAAANAITILNVAGYDFNGRDMSQICIPYANLSYGIFEGTKWRNADLQGVDFSGAWLKDAYFEKANMKRVAFGKMRLLKVKGERISNIAFSLNGKFLAIGIKEEQIVIFENRVNKYKEIRRFPGHLPGGIDCPFSKDGKQIVTVLENRSIIWDVITGQFLEEYNQLTQRKQIVHFNSVQGELLFFDRGKFKKYDLKSEKWIDLPIVKHAKYIHELQISSDCNRLLLVGVEKREIILYNSTNGRSILKQRREVRSGKLRSDGKMITFRTKEIAHLFDSVRGYIMKSFASYCYDDKDFCNDSSYQDQFDIENRSLNSDGNLIVSLSSRGNAIEVQDATSPSSINKISFGKRTGSGKYFVDFTKQQIAMVKNSGLIVFKTISQINHQLNRICPFAKGSNSTGLNLKGTVMSNCTELSDENIAIFQEKGDYGIFNESIISQLFSDSPADSESVREVSQIAGFRSPIKLTTIHAKMIGYDQRSTNLRKLDLSRNPIGEDGGQAIANNKSWLNLEELILAHTGIEDKTATIIANNQTWKNLKRLELPENEIGNVGAAAIGKSKEWPKLEILNLRKNEIGDEGAIIIGGNLQWKNLTTIDLRSNKISDQHSLHLICSNSAWSGLKVVELQNNPVDLRKDDIFKIIEDIPSKNLIELTLPQAKFDQFLLQNLKYCQPKDVAEISGKDKGFLTMSAIVLGSNTTWTNLKSLNFSCNQIGDEGGVKIGSNCAWINLEELNLSDCYLGVKSGIAIGDNKTWQKLRILNLNSNSIGSEGACRIGVNTTWVDLQVLQLAKNKIGVLGARELGKNVTWVNLHTLDLSCSDIGDEGTGESRQNTIWINLQALNLGWNGIGVIGARVLNQNTTWKNLQLLNLYNNKIGSEGAGELSKKTPWINLQSLNLLNNEIGDDGAGELSNNTTWINLQTLELYGNNISVKGAGELSKNKTWANLRELRLQSNNICDEGARELSKNTTWVKLEKLILQHNNIGDKGACELGKNATWTKLEKLNLASNKIGKKGHEELKKNATWTKLEELDIGNNKLDDDEDEEENE